MNSYVVSFVTLDEVLRFFFRCMVHVAVFVVVQLHQGRDAFSLAAHFGVAFVQHGWSRPLAGLPLGVVNKPPEPLGLPASTHKVIPRCSGAPVTSKSAS